jgi:diguanylate cyclase (GGDEF)-like protein/PAS domain S-box-containing protein
MGPTAQQRAAPARPAHDEGRVAYGRVYACIALLIVLTFLVDMNFEFVAFGGFYAIPILISLWLKSFRATLALTALCCALTLGEVIVFAARASTPDAIPPLSLQQLVGNHAVEVASLVVVCLIGYWRLRDERELEESRETTATTLSAIAEGVITLDAQRRVTYANPLAEELLGVERGAALGRAVDEVLVLTDEKAVRATIEDLPQSERAPRMTRALLSPPQGAPVRVELARSDLRHADGAQRGEVIVFRDITEREQRERDMKTLAYRDTLTNLPNRLSLHELLSLELAHARRNRGSLAVLFVDLDDFKQVNDTRGHAAGDELLRATAERLRANLRETDTVARLGGDEFAVVLPGAQDVRDVELVAAKLLAALDEPVLFEGHALRARASIGMAMFPEDGTEADMLLRRADQAMYRAKQEGGGRLAVASKPRQSSGR